MGTMNVASRNISNGRVREMANAFLRRCERRSWLARLTGIAMVVTAISPYLIYRSRLLGSPGGKTLFKRFALVSPETYVELQSGLGIGR